MDGGTTNPYSPKAMQTQPRVGSSAALGTLYAVGAALAFSTAGVIVRRIDLPAWDVSFVRSILLVAAISPLLVLRYRRVLEDFRRAGRWLFLSALFLAGSAVAFIVALSLAPVANVLIVCGATPFVTALLARMLLHEPLSRHTIVAMIVPRMSHTRPTSTVSSAFSSRFKPHTSRPLEAPFWPVILQVVDIAS